MIYTLHGWSYDRRVWKGTSFERAVHLELPGHGESPFKSTDLERLSLEIGETLKEGSTVVGWSLGATVSILIGLYYPEKIKEIILYAPTPSFTELSQPEAVVRKFLKKLRRNFHDGVMFFRELSSRKKLPLPPLEPRNSIALLESFVNFNCLEAVREVKAPVKVVVGEEDGITGVKGAFEVFRNAARPELKIVPGADHLTVLEHAI